MHGALRISALAKRSGVPSKTIRYWESLGLLPKAARSHTGYREFDPAALRYVAFIQKSKAIGLTLAEMHEILQLARRGRCPCPEVIGWTQAKAKSVTEQIHELSALLRRLQRIERGWKRCSCSSEKGCDVCSLIADLPERKFFRGGKNGKNLECCGDRPVLSGLSARMPAVLPSRLSRRREATN